MTSGTAAPSISPAAYFAALLHAFKYVAKPVIGVLVADAARPLAITRAIPVAHATLPSAVATLDLATTMLASYLRDANLVAAGVYVAPAHVDVSGASSKDPVDGNVINIGVQILAALGNPKGFVAVLDTARLANHDKIVLRPLTNGTPSITGPAKSTLAVLPTALPLSSDLFDLEDHLEDVSRDWIANPALYTLLDALVSKA
ncbi:ER membrane protein complex subunit 8 [Blastocladiella emersonii ATCC 22665]|nr:ER membrane protein complex subunit 8 [Blastocladiella emersonii ATCC 22665]